MKNNVKTTMIAVSMLFFSTLSSKAQTAMNGDAVGAIDAPQQESPFMRCYRTAAQSNASQNEQKAMLEQAIQEYVEGQNGVISATAPVIRIPVVVHVVYNQLYDNSKWVVNGVNQCDTRIPLTITWPASSYFGNNMNIPSYITQSYVQQTITDVNNELANPSAQPHWQSRIGSPRIQLYLADQDPSGNSSTGVVYKYDPAATEGTYKWDDNNYRNVKMISPAWPTNRYLNIWVAPTEWSVWAVASFPYTSSQIPDGELGTPYDGIVMNRYSFGGGSNNPNNFAIPGSSGPQLFIHELGHYLGLEHNFTFGDGKFSDADVDPCGDYDYVADTPPQDFAHGGYRFPCTLTYNKCAFNNCIPYYGKSCGNTNNDMNENYMDYNASMNMTMFTQGQVNRMRGFLNTARTELWTPQSDAYGKKESNTGSNFAEKSTSLLGLFPNPSDDNTSVSLYLAEANNNISIEVKDLTGKTISIDQVNSTSGNYYNYTLNTSKVPNGVYFISINVNERPLPVQKFVKY